MELSVAGLAILKQSEGFRGRTYRDAEGIPTIGYGHKLLPRESYPSGITEAEATVILSRDLALSEGSISRLARVPLTQGQFDALVDFVFNLGQGRLESSTLLKDLNAGVAQRVQYQSREVEGTQSPSETLDRGWGSCRDFAVLFTEAARKLGFGARLVSGYLHDPDHDLVGSAEAGSTHAWAEVFVPGAGWITFDPTNRSVGGRNLIPVAVARDISQCTPVSGSYFGVSDNFLSMDVTVSVTS